VCKFYGLKKEEILSRKRTKNIAEARQVAMYLITEYINLPLDNIGSIFGKDHSTVIYAKNKIADDIKKSKKLEIQINDMKQMIEGK
jgi:chromosomal replication initiator protein